VYLIESELHVAWRGFWTLRIYTYRGWFWWYFLSIFNLENTVQTNLLWV